MRPRQRHPLADVRSRSFSVTMGPMDRVEVPIPDGLLAALRKAPHELAAELRLAAAIHWYQQGALSLERAAETAGLERAAFLAELARRGIDVFTIDEQDLAVELARG